MVCRWYKPCETTTTYLYLYHLYSWSLTWHLPGTCNLLYRYSRSGPAPLSTPPFALTAKSSSPPDPSHWSEDKDQQQHAYVFMMGWNNVTMWKYLKKPKITSESKRGDAYSHAQCSQGLLPHGHSHALLLSSGLPTGCFNLQVDVTVLPQGLQKVLCQSADAFVTGYLLQLMQVGYRVCADQHLDRKQEARHVRLRTFICLWKSCWCRLLCWAMTEVF